MSITGLFDSMDRQIGQILAPKSNNDTGTDPGCIYSPLSGIPPPFLINGVPVDPIREENQKASNFTIRWVAQGEFDDAGCVPARNDSLTIEDGTVYNVVQIQAGVDRGVRLILEKAPKSKQNG